MSPGFVWPSLCLLLCFGLFLSLWRSLECTGTTPTHLTCPTATTTHQQCCESERVTSRSQVYFSQSRPLTATCCRCAESAITFKPLLVHISYISHHRYTTLQSNPLHSTPLPSRSSQHTRFDCAEREDGGAIGREFNSIQFNSAGACAVVLHNTASR
jgi:hypothetical protein